MKDEKILERLKREILAIQTKKPIYVGKEIIGEDGNTVESGKPLDWSNMSAQLLGKCGELYAQYIMEYCGYQTFTSSVDNHGIDLLAKDNQGKVYKVQVKTVSAGSYTFIREKHFEEDLIVFYFRIVGEKANLYIYHRNNFPKPDSKNANIDQFIYRPYNKVGQKSEPEYGISGAKKYYENIESPYYVNCNDWTPDKSKVVQLM